jgi:cation efflux system protein involved in nickel and cobalt tolerance
MRQTSDLQKIGQNQPRQNQPRQSRVLFPWSRFSKLWLAAFITGILIAAVGLRQRGEHSHPQNSTYGYLPDLAMKDGDPYVRALMRTISASESNAKAPYGLLYGGKHTHDLGQHPDVCIPIRVGVNRGDCSTAAGRYQFITSTWQEKSSLYHPNPIDTQGSTLYPFEPEYQDKVAYQWLKDEQMWSTNIPERLRQGEINEVLRLLSGTWTSLGSGIEDNSVTPYLTEIYQRVLAEEIRRS